MQSLPEASLDTPYKTAALTVLALCAYAADKNIGTEMLNWLRGTRPIKLRQRGSDENWFLWEQYLLTGVRTPKEADIIKVYKSKIIRRKIMSELLASLPQIAVCLIICAAKIVEISIQSLKTCMMVKGQRLKAAGLGFIECVIWGLVISTIIGTLGDNLFLLLFYCIGYATGLYLGSTIENKIALGTSNLQLIANDENTQKIINYLKEHNRGYTVFEGHGSIDKMNMIFIVLSRRETPVVLKDIRLLCENKVFVVTSEVSKYAGGYGMVK